MHASPSRHRSNWLGVLLDLHKTTQTPRGVPLEFSLSSVFKYLFTQYYLVGGKASGQKKKLYGSVWGH